MAAECTKHDLECNRLGYYKSSEKSFKPLSDALGKRRVKDVIAKGLGIDCWILGVHGTGESSLGRAHRIHCWRIHKRP
jgi:hypothetical protein